MFDRTLMFRSRTAGPTMASLIGMMTLGCAGGPVSAELTPTPQASPTAAAPSETNTDAPHGGQLEVVQPDLRLAPEGAAVFEELLSFLPDRPEYRRSVLMDDVEAVGDRFGIDPPEPDADREAVLDYLRALGQHHPRFLGENWVFGFPPYLREIDTYPYLALDHRQADQNITAGHLFNVIEITRGRFDPDMTAAALAACNDCPEPQLVEHSGAVFYAWGEDPGGALAMRFAPPMYDEAGRGGRLWLTDQYAVRTLRDDPMQEVIETRMGNTHSLADSPEFVLAARGLAGLGALTAMMSDADHSVDSVLEQVISMVADPDRRTEEDVRDAVIGQPPLLPFSVAALGTGYDAHNRLYTAVVLVHDDAAIAEANIDRLLFRIGHSAMPIDGRPWTDAISRVEISADGRVLLARVFEDRLFPRLAPSDGFPGGGVAVPNGLLVHE